MISRRETLHGAIGIGVSSVLGIGSGVAIGKNLTKKNFLSDCEMAKLIGKENCDTIAIVVPLDDIIESPNSFQTIWVKGAKQRSKCFRMETSYTVFDDTIRRTDVFESLYSTKETRIRVFDLLHYYTILIFNSNSTTVFCRTENGWINQKEI